MFKVSLIIITLSYIFVPSATWFYQRRAHMPDTNRNPDIFREKKIHSYKIERPAIATIPDIDEDEQDNSMYDKSAEERENEEENNDEFEFVEIDNDKYKNDETTSVPWNKQTPLLSNTTIMYMVPSRISAHQQNGRLIDNKEQLTFTRERPSATSYKTVVNTVTTISPNELGRIEENQTIVMYDESAEKRENADREYGDDDDDDEYSLSTFYERFGHLPDIERNPDLYLIPNLRANPQLNNDTTLTTTNPPDAQNTTETTLMYDASAEARENTEKQTDDEYLQNTFYRKAYHLPEVKYNPDIFTLLNTKTPYNGDITGTTSSPDEHDAEEKKGNSTDEEFEEDNTEIERNDDFEFVEKDITTIEEDVPEKGDTIQLNKTIHDLRKYIKFEKCKKDTEQIETFALDNSEEMVTSSNEILNPETKLQIETSQDPTQDKINIPHQHIDRIYAPYPNIFVDSHQNNHLTFTREHVGNKIILKLYKTIPVTTN